MNDKKEIKISKRELQGLQELYKRARTTPVIYTSGPISWADQAWNEVTKFMDKLGAKYGFNPKQMKGIDSTGKVNF